jgi:hypothetical protein
MMACFLAIDKVGTELASARSPILSAALHKACNILRRRISILSVLASLASKIRRPPSLPGGNIFSLAPSVHELQYLSGLGALERLPLFLNSWSLIPSRPDSLLASFRSPTGSSRVPSFGGRTASFGDHPPKMRPQSILRKELDCRIDNSAST